MKQQQTAMDRAAQATPGRGGASYQAGATPGKQTLVERVMGHEVDAPVQRKAEVGAGRDAGSRGDVGGRDHVRAAAARGTSGAPQALPYLDVIQRCFGRHDVRGVKAHLGAAATEGAKAVRAAAFTSKEQVVFARPPSLFVAAHEAAHVIQQRGGVQLAQGIDEPGDVHERHADAVAERVVRGESAEQLLDAYAGGGGPASSPDVQRYKEVPADVEAALGLPEGSRVSELGNLLTTGRDAYATPEVIAGSEAALEATSARVTLRQGAELANAAALRASPPGPRLYQVIPQPRAGASEPTRALGKDAQRFNANPAEFTAEAERRKAALDRFIAQLEAYEQTRAGGPAKADTKTVTDLFTEWVKGWGREISPTFEEDVNPAAREIQYATEGGKVAWDDVAKLRRSYTSLSESYARDLLPENLDRMVVPGDCGQCAQYLAQPAAEGINEGARAPKVGEAMKVGYGDVHPDGWNYHQAATMMKDGNDIATLETAADPAATKLTRSGAKFQMYGQGKQNFWAEGWVELAQGMAERGVELPPQLIAGKVREASRLPGAPGARLELPGEIQPASEPGTPRAAPTAAELDELRAGLEAEGRASGSVAQDAASTVARDAGEGAHVRVAGSVSESIERFLARYASRAGKLLVGLAVLVDSVLMAEAIYKDILGGDLTLPNTRPVLGGIIGGWVGAGAGAALGAQAGAVLGSMVPGIGTFIGGIAGGILGGLIGGALGGAAGATAANTSPVGKAVKAILEATVPELGAQKRIREKQGEVETALRDSLASQAAAFAHSYTADPGYTIHANIEWKITYIIVSGRRDLGEVSLVKARYEPAPGPTGTELSFSGFFVQTETQVRRETYPAPLADFLPHLTFPAPTRPPYIVSTPGEAFATS